MNQKDAAIILDALQAALEVVPSSWHVAKLNRAIDAVAPYAQPYEVGLKIFRPQAAPQGKLKQKENER